MGIRLCDNSLDDLDALLKLNFECYADDDPATAPRMLKVVKHNTCWVYDDKGIRASLLSELSSGQPYIWSVATTSSYRGKGVAGSLLKEFEKYYTQLGYSKLWLHVRTDNPAQKLYFDNGYRVTSFERGIYGVGLHGLVMQKRID